MRRFALSGAVLLAIGCSDDSVAGGSGGAGTGGEASGGGGSGGGGEASCTGTEPDDPQFAQAMELLRQTLAVHAIPGGAIAVIKDGQVVNVGVSGTKTAGVCDPVTPDTLFGTTTVSVVLTNIAALDAVDEGKLSLAEPITDIVPIIVESGAEYADDITLHHLLTWTSMYTSASNTEELSETCTSLEDWFASPVDAVIEAAPGSMHDSSDWTNAELAGRVLEVVDGEPFPSVISDRVLGPLGMGGAFDLATIAGGDYSHGHQSGGGQVVNPDCRSHDPSFGYYGSIKDLAKLGEYLTADGGQILEPDTYVAMSTAQDENFFSSDFVTYINRGWFNPELGEDMLFIGGQVHGFSSGFFVFRDSGVMVITVVNAPHQLDEVNFALAQIYDVNASWGPEYVSDPATLPSLVGVYEDPIGLMASGPRRLEVVMKPDDPTRIEGTLILLDAGESYAVSFEAFVGADNFTTDTGQNVRFWRDDAGAPYAVQVEGNAGPPFFMVPEP